MIRDRINITIKGVTPLIICNPRLANVLDPGVNLLKSLTGARKKTEKDTKEILKLQWELGLYWTDEMGLYIPSEMLSASFHKAATIHKLGKKTIGVVFNHPLGYELITDDHKNLNKLKENDNNKFVRLVKIGKNMVLSSRPIFNKWQIKFDLEIDPGVIDEREIMTILLTMCDKTGLGVWRPSSPKPGHYGKFIIESLVHIDGESGKTKILVGEK